MTRNTLSLGVLAATAVLASSVALADTIVLKNGETFSGTITRITPTAIEVNTTFAGNISVKRESVKTLRSENKVTVLDAEGTPHTAFIAPVADVAGWRETDAVAPAVVTAPAPALIAPPAPEKVYNLDLEGYWLPVGPHWKNQFALGLVNTTGNTESTNFAAEVSFNYKQKPREFNLKIGGVYDVTEGRQTAGLFYLDAIYRRSLVEWDPSERWYAFGEDHVLYDAIKGISYRNTVAMGLGYYVIKEEKFNLDLRAGPAYVCEKFFDGDTESSMAGLAGLRATYVFNERASLSQDVFYTVSLCDSSNYQITSETALNFKLPEVARGAGLKLGFRDDYDNSAPSAAKRNDTRFTLALTLDF